MEQDNEDTTYDLAIIGGGINGTAIAREAALNGLSVVLFEKDDLASHTSSASTKLIHGGLRYLEFYEFGLVREALRERERLLHLAPHLIYPMHFVLPHRHSTRPWWMIRIGLWLYDHIGGRMSLDRSRALHPQDTAYLAPLKDVRKGFVYSDCWVDDARLVVLNAVDAARHGAEIRTHCPVARAVRNGDAWDVEDVHGAKVRARALINAAGPWVAQMLAASGVASRSSVRLVKGSHIVVPRMFDGDHAYMLQQPDGRIVFAIAYVGGTTLVGTTDVPVDKPEDASISDAEIAYLLTAVNTYFKREIRKEEVIASYSGVRPLYDDGSEDAKAVTRDYTLEIDGKDAPLLSVFGGKITTARQLAEDALSKLSDVLDWPVDHASRSAPYPGGDMPDGFAPFFAHVQACWPFLGQERSHRMARAYGTRLPDLLADVRSAADLGTDFGGGLTQVEVDWLVRREWATTADDILLRRTKIGLVTGPDTRDRLTAYLRQRAAQDPLGI